MLPALVATAIFNRAALGGSHRASHVDLLSVPHEKPCSHAYCVELHPLGLMSVTSLRHRYPVKIMIEIPDYGPDASTNPPRI